MNDNEKYVFPDKPAYGVPETVDYTKLTNQDVPGDLGDGPGFNDESELPESDYPEVGEDHDDDSV